MLPIIMAVLSCAHAPRTPETVNTASVAAPSPEQGLHLQGAPPPSEIATERQSGDSSSNQHPTVTENPGTTEQTETSSPDTKNDPQDLAVAEVDEQSPCSAEDSPGQDIAAAPPRQDQPSSSGKDVSLLTPKGGGLSYRHDPRIDEYMNRHLTRDRAYFEYCLERFDKVRPTMERIFMEHGLPKDLVYLAMVESGGNPNAVSPAGAVGYWQFLPGTARLYGLRVDRWVDERRDLEKSTHAAAAYLAYLHDLFDDWLLACAAYNAGEGAIRRLLERNDHVDSFWDISRSMLYKDETLSFVPKILATIKIAKDRRRYGIKYYDEGLPPCDTIRVAAFTTFDELADVSGCSVSTLAGLNPELIRKCTPPHTEGYDLKIPRGMAGALTSVLTDRNRKDDMRRAAYVVQKGDTLFGLARKHGTTPAKIAAINGISVSSKLSIGSKLIIPEDIYLKAVERPSYAVAKSERGKDPSATRLTERHEETEPSVCASKARPEKNRLAKASPNPSIYRVRKGDTIWAISRRFDVDPKDIMRWNRTLGQIKPGEKLKIFAREPS